MMISEPVQELSFWLPHAHSENSANSDLMSDTSGDMSPSVFVVYENPFSLFRDPLVNLERRIPVDLCTWYISGD